MMASVLVAGSAGAASAVSSPRSSSIRIRFLPRGGMLTRRAASGRLLGFTLRCEGMHAVRNCGTWCSLMSCMLFQLQDPTVVYADHKQDLPACDAFAVLLIGTSTYLEGLQSGIGHNPVHRCLSAPWGATSFPPTGTSPHQPRDLVKPRPAAGSRDNAGEGQAKARSSSHFEFAQSVARIGTGVAIQGKGLTMQSMLARGGMTGLRLALAQGGRSQSIRTNMKLAVVAQRSAASGQAGFSSQGASHGIPKGFLPRNPRAAGRPYPSHVPG